MNLLFGKLCLGDFQIEHMVVQCIMFKAAAAKLSNASLETFITVSAMFCWISWREVMSSKNTLFFSWSKVHA